MIMIKWDDDNYEEFKKNFNSMIITDSQRNNHYSITKEIITCHGKTLRGVYDSEMSLDDFVKLINEEKLPYNSLEQLLEAVGGWSNYRKIIEWGNEHIPDIMWVYYFNLYQFEKDSKYFPIVILSLRYIKNIFEYPGNIPGLGKSIRSKIWSKYLNSYWANTIVLYILLYVLYLIVA